MYKELEIEIKIEIENIQYCSIPPIVDNKDVMLYHVPSMLSKT